MSDKQLAQEAQEAQEALGGYFVWEGQRSGLKVWILSGSGGIAS